MKKFFKSYIDNAEIPFRVTLGVCLAFNLLSLFLILILGAWSKILSVRSVINFLVILPLGVCLLPILGMFVVGVSQLVRRLWRKGLTNLLLILAALIAVVIISVPFNILMVHSAIQEEDNFGKNVIIPNGMKVESVPDGNPWGEQKGKAEDVLSDQSFADLSPEALDELQKKAKEVRNYPVIKNIWFPEITGERRKILLRHLATSCRWRLSLGWDGVLFATRRFIVKGQWLGDDYYGDVQNKGVFIFPDRVAGFAQNDFQGYKTHARAGTEPIKLKLTKMGDNSLPGNVSELSLSSGKSVIEIHDTDGQATQKLLNSLGDELQSVLSSEAAKNKGFDVSLMPDFSIKKGDAELKVFKTPEYSWSPGHYTVNAFVNPGEEGHVFLKVFEATTNTSLEVRWDSVEYTGWSDNPDEKFFYSYALTIDKGQPSWSYPARFELWFKPADSKKAERKLIEKIYSVSGGGR